MGTKVPRPRARRRYTDAFRASALAALDANGGNVERTARDLDLPRKTVEGWAQGRTDVPADLRHEKRQELAEAVEDCIRRLCGGIAVREGDPVDKVAVAVGILTDKLLLLRDRPTPTDPKDPNSPAFDVSRLTREELWQLVELHDKARGVPPLKMASDLEYPVCVDDDSPCGYTLPNGPRPGTEDQYDPRSYAHLQPGGSGNCVIVERE